MHVWLLHLGLKALGSDISRKASLRYFLALATSSKLSELVAYLACLWASVMAAKLILSGGATK